MIKESSGKYEQNINYEEVCDSDILKIQWVSYKDWFVNTIHRLSEFSESAFSIFNPRATVAVVDLL